MSLIRPFACLAALLALLGAASEAAAQRYQPFIDPGYFEPDFQFFAPAEVGDFGDGEPPNTGVYIDYDRTYINMTRPDGEASLFSPFEGDWTWGNRWELGYMTEEDTGWQVVAWHITGPNEAITFFQERIDRLNPDDEPPEDPDPIVQDRNPRNYILETSLNKANYAAFELNKTWRRKEFHNGSILEPLIGFRFMKFKDRYRRDTYERFASDIVGQPVPGVPTVDGRFEELTTDGAIFDNNMVGGQLGFRFFHQRGHWLLSTDIRFFACQNFQSLETMTSTRLTRYDTPAGDDVQLELNDTVHAWQNADEFVWGGEVRAEASYELTREINLRFGMVFLDLGQGIGRGNDILLNTQDVQMAGVTFGVTINR
jgi:hypothetical protein